MTFTDDDLKRLKDCVDYKEPLIEQFHKLPSLLARLEAAEAYRQATLEYLKTENHSGSREMLHADEEWRKAAGRD